MVRVTNLHSNVTCVELGAYCGIHSCHSYMYMYNVSSRKYKPDNMHMLVELSRGTFMCFKTSIPVASNMGSINLLIAALEVLLSTECHDLQTCIG